MQTVHFIPIKQRWQKEELADLQSEVKHVRLEWRLSVQCFHYDTKEVWEPTTKTIIDTSEQLLEGMNVSNVHVKNWEFMNKTQECDTSLIRALASF